MPSAELDDASSDTRALILHTARALMLTRAYLGLSFQELADRVGIRKPSLYHHFPSKEALALAVIADSRRRFERWTEGLAALAPHAQAAAYIAMFRDQIGASRQVCLVGATAAEWDGLEPALQAAARGFLGVQLDWLTGVALRRDVDSGRSPTPAQVAAARQWAAQLNALCQGALLSARLQGDAAWFDAALAPLQASLADSAGPAGPAAPAA